MRDISPAVAEQIVNSINTFLVQLGRYAASANRDPGDAGLVNQVRIAAAALAGAIDAVGRIPMITPTTVQPPAGAIGAMGPTTAPGPAPTPPPH